MNRKALIFLVACLFLRLAERASADVVVKLRLEHAAYLQYEHVQAFVTVFNDEDYNVVLDSGITNRTDSLRFRIKRNSRDDAVLINRTPIVEFLELQPGEKKSFMVDLGMWYSISQVGSYDIQAELEYGGRKWLSNLVQIDVVDGIETSSVSRSVPGSPGRARKYSLRYWNRGKREYLFLRAEDEKNDLVYGVFLLGNVVRIFNPLLEVDRKGNIVVVHQSGRNMYTRTTFKSESHSVKFIDQVYTDENGAPYNRKRR